MMRNQYSLHNKGGQMRHKNEIKAGRRLKTIFAALAAWLAIILPLLNVVAQQSLNATGGDAAGSGGSAAYSAGQLFYHTIQGANASAAEGVQQPYEISVVTALEGTVGIKLSVSAYPNPADDYLILDVHDFDLSGLHYRLLDVNGKLVRNGLISENKTNIVTGMLARAAYFLKVMRGSTEVKTFMMIKK